MIRKLRKPRKPGKKKTGITWSAIRKANKKRKASGLEIKFYQLLTEAGIKFKKEKCIGRCHVDIFIEPNLAIELNGCYWHGCQKCFPNPSATQKKARIKDAKRYLFFQKKEFKVVVLWECDIEANPDKAIKTIKDLLDVS